MLGNFRDRLLQIRLERDEKEIKIGFTVSAVIIFILLLNIAYLNSFILGSKKASVVSVKQNSSPSPTQEILPTPTSSVQSNLNTTAVQGSSVKDYFIPLGSGSVQSSDDWADVQGAQASIDFGRYQNIKEIRFEASVSVPSSSQFVSVRLFNKTDKHPVWYSDVSTNGESSAYLVSSPISYDSGEKLYQVQMKTQLAAPASLTQGRIHIVLR